MTSRARLSLNPYQPPESIDTDVSIEPSEELRIPTLGELLIGAAACSSVPALIVLASSATSWVILLTLFFIWPLCFRYFLIRTYRMQSQDVPRFRWMPFLTLAILIFLTTIAAVLIHVVSLIASRYPGLSTWLNEEAMFTPAIGMFLGMMCLTVDYVVSISITRQNHALRSILPPLIIALAGSLSAIIARDSLLPSINQFVSKTPNLRPIIIGAAVGALFSIATFYACIRIHSAVREGLQKALSDPRQSHRGRFKI